MDYKDLDNAVETNSGDVGIYKNGGLNGNNTFKTRKRPFNCG